MNFINFLIYRRVDPSFNEIASKSLSKLQNELNLKKFYVNAHVKAMISFLETMSNIVYIIVVYFTVRTSFVTLSIHLSVYMIILPYAFLKNTSHNKEQVIEHGWVHVFQNVLKKSGDAKSGEVKSGEAKSSKSIDVVKIGEHNPPKQPYNKETQEIFVTPSSSNNEFALKNSDISSVALDKNQPCSSKGYKDSIERRYTSVTRLDVKTLPFQHGNNESTSKRLIKKMSENIDVEEIYIEYFKEFVAYAASYFYCCS